MVDLAGDAIRSVRLWCSWYPLIIPREKRKGETDSLAWNGVSGREMGHFAGSRSERKINNVARMRTDWATTRRGFSGAEIGGPFFGQRDVDAVN